VLIDDGKCGFQRWFSKVLEEMAAETALVVVSVAVASGMLAVLLPMGNK
jgi:hypothetical protein